MYRRNFRTSSQAIYICQPSVSIVRQLSNSQIGGPCLNTLGHLPRQVLEDLDLRLGLRGIPQLIHKASQHMTIGCTKAQLSSVLKGLLKKISHQDSMRHTYGGSSAQDDNMKECCEIIIEYSGVDVILRILMDSSSLPWSADVNREDQNELPLKNICLEILRRLFLLDETFPSKLPYSHDLLCYLFTLLVDPRTQVSAAAVIECILHYRKEVLNLSLIPNIKEIIKLMDDSALANLCQILSVCISDLDTYEHKSSLYQQNRQKRTKGFVAMREVNQELLMSIPNLLSRLVHLIRSTRYEPRFPRIANELDTWMQWIDDEVSEEGESSITPLNLDEFFGDPVLLQESEIQARQHRSLKMSTTLINRVEVFYTLGLFLVGKHRKKVQRQLADLKLVPVLSEIFDQFIWKASGRQGNRRLRGHNSSCECSPEVALKIQFLRLVHSFCDHSDHKHLLLSRIEVTELRRLNDFSEKSKSSAIDDVDTSLICRGSKGLLTKIVEVLKKEPPASTFRFWLARAVESYLRGSTCYADQIFLLRRSLLQHVANNLIENDIRPKEILQSSFDLLGEMIKFNPDVFEQFDKIVNNDLKFRKLVELVERNLVDSNMFIRSLVLSLERFCSRDEVSEEAGKYDDKSSRLLKYVGSFQSQINFVQKLINVITVKSLTQENVSCLNTALVFLMFAYRRGELNNYLEALKNHTRRSASNNGLLANFRELLTFWQDHYLHKDKDCSALERSSRISFDQWKQIVNMLLSKDHTQDTSLIHHLPEDDLPRGN